MTSSERKIVTFGALGGAAIAVVVVFAAAAMGYLPAQSNDRAIHDYLMAHPDLVVAMSNKLQQQQDDTDAQASQAAVDKLGMKAFFDPNVAFIAGPAKAKRTLVEFFDYNCPYCRQSLPAIKKFYALHKNDTRFAFIEFPFKGPDSTFAARVAIAARKQGDKYLNFYFALMGEADKADTNLILADAAKSGLDMNRLQADLKAPSIDLGLSESLALAQAAKLDGTPFFIVNGKIHSGAVDEKSLAQLAKG